MKTAYTKYRINFNFIYAKSYDSETHELISSGATGCSIFEIKKAKAYDKMCLENMGYIQESFTQEK